MTTDLQEYQLFPSTTLSSSTTPQIMTYTTLGLTEEQYHQITKEELEKIKKKKNMFILSNIIEKSLGKKPEKIYNLTKYTLFEIDEIQADIHISIDDEITTVNGLPTYIYKIISKNIYYEYEDDMSRDFVIYDNTGFETIISVLEDIEFVKKHYKMLDYYLLSPEHMEGALAQRAFIPIASEIPGTSTKINATGLGNAGGNGSRSSTTPFAGGGGGGGGSGAPGQSAPNPAVTVASIAGNGGNGTSNYSEVLNNISTVMVTAWRNVVNVSGTYYIAAGGGGGSWGDVAAATSGYGGDGTGGTSGGNGSSCTANTGSGGGGGGDGRTPATSTGGNGGSGLVVIWY
jgi:hypothetical protein